MKEEVKRGLRQDEKKSWAGGRFARVAVCGSQPPLTLLFLCAFLGMEITYLEPSIHLKLWSFNLVSSTIIAV